MRALQRQPRVLSLFSGAGGLDYGLEAAGFEIAAALDSDSDACRTLRSNRPRWPVLESAVEAVCTSDLLAAAGLSRGRVELLVAGPPCQPFSKSGYWASGTTLRLRDHRATTLHAFMRVVEEALPRVVLLENVKGLAFSGKEDGLDFLRNQLQRINVNQGTRYRATVLSLNAVDYGVPQKRERLFVVAARDGRGFAPPRPTHCAPADAALLSLEPYRTSWDALAEVGPDPGEDLAVKGRWADLLPSIPEGANYLHHTDRGAGLRLFGWRTRYWTFLLKLAKNSPAWTIQAQPGPAVGPFHWSNRRLSWRELCRLQTFPDNLGVTGSRASAQRQIGNAVPSLLAEVLGRAIREQLLGHTRPRGPLRLLPQNRGPAPPPEPVRPVPRKYRSLIKEHRAHPGTGRGPGARQHATARGRRSRPAA